jgi:hypothetical protein
MQVFIIIEVGVTLTASLVTYLVNKKEIYIYIPTAHWHFSWVLLPICKSS